MWLTYYLKVLGSRRVITKAKSVLRDKSSKCGWDLLIANINSIILQKYYNYIKNHIKFEKNVEILYNYKQKVFYNNKNGEKYEK